MKERMLLRKTCSICASDMHFATIIVPFVRDKVARNTILKTMLEKDERENIEKIIQNMGLNSEIKKKIKNIDWEKSNIEKIRNNFNELEKEINKKLEVNIIVQGSNIFIEKINDAIDLWVKNNMKKIEENIVKINVINNFLYEENEEINSVLNKHDYILKTVGIENILYEEFEKAN